VFGKETHDDVLELAVLEPLYNRFVHSLGLFGILKQKSTTLRTTAELEYIDQTAGEWHG
jgi:hypothetical protein